MNEVTKWYAEKIGKTPEEFDVMDRYVENILKVWEKERNEKKHYYHNICGKCTLEKEYEHSNYGTMLMVKPINKRDMFFAPKKEFTELPF